MTRPGRRPGRRWAARTGPGLLALVVSVALCATAGATTTTTSTTRPPNPWVAGTGGSLTVGVDQGPTGCNPNSATGDTWADQLVLLPVLPSAFFVGPGNVPSYDSAVISQAEVIAAPPTAKHQTVQYTINPKAVWSDGVPITAKDFIYAWDQQRGPTTAATSTATTDVATTQGYRDILSVKGSHSGRVVTVVFRQPFADWKMLFNYLLPAHVMEKAGWDPHCNDVAASVDLSGGPFKVGKVVPGKEVVLVRNPRWWGSAPNLQRITVRVASGSTQLARWLADGKAQVIEPTAFDSDFLEQVTQQRSADSSDTVSPTFLQLDYSTTSAVTGDLAVRQALSHAIDRRDLVNSVVGWANSSIVPAASHLYSQAQAAYPGPKPASVEQAGQPTTTTTTTPNPPTAARPYPLTSDLDETDHLLITEGYVRGAAGTWVQPNGKPLVLRLAVDTGDTWAKKSADVIVHELHGAGIPVKLSSAPDAETTGRQLADGSADAALLPYDATPYPTQAIAWYTPLLGTPGVDGSQDWSRFSDPTLNSTLTQAARDLNPVSAATLYAKADLFLWQEMVTLPLFAEPTVTAWSTYVAGVGPNPNGPGLLWFPQTWALRVPPTSPNTVPPT